MTTLQRQTSLFGEDELIFSQEDSPASLIALREKEKAKKILATSGQKCLEQFDRFNRATLWGKTFVGLLIGTEGWYSTKCRLTWKMRVTKSYRLWFQLVASTPHIDETGFGLLPTPICMDTNNGDLTKVDARRKKAIAKNINGNGFGQTLGELAQRGLLPTPNARDWKGRTSDSRNHETLPDFIDKIHGKNSRLSPQFVMEMMGFPPNWTELPFLNGETSLSKEEEMQ